MIYGATAGLGALGAGKGFGSLTKFGTYAPSTVAGNLRGSFINFKYKTYMNNLALAPHYFKYFLQKQNIKHNMIQQISKIDMEEIMMFLLKKNT